MHYVFEASPCGKDQWAEVRRVPNNPAAREEALTWVSARNPNEGLDYRLLRVEEDETHVVLVAHGMRH